MGTTSRRADAARLRGKSRAATLLTAAASTMALALVVSGCSGGTVAVGAQPKVTLPQPGAVVTGSPSAAPTAGPPKCNTSALSYHPTAGDASSAAVSNIKKRGKLIVGVAQDEYLTGYLDASGNETGFDVEIAKQVEQAIFGNQDPKNIQFRAVTNAERITALQTDDPARAVDMVVDTFTITCDRSKQVQFSSVYYNAYQRLLVLKNSGYRNLDDLGGKKVCAQNGSTSIQTLMMYKSHPIPYGVTNLTDCLVALQQGQVDAISTDDTILAGLAQQDPNTAVVGDRVEPEPYGIAVSPGNTGLIRFVNGVLETIRGNGQWQKIYQNSLGSVLGPQQPPAAQYAD
ncbi:glutamate ABC transporter substrate-binding protein [Actinocrinis sp.]|uniref:glutamate ABC transporter substrate-binding protein n=1 Tax=Actinocrinis sp. TaxID=1920516 RepID=UPI002D2CABCE|nr:glutamate ABC transporter substrate-binding protein [Actinocrinis sp.]HZP53114.1 glutamate ABC transporter substrate-binding protein [Actinocrinis sp.]